MRSGSSVKKLPRPGMPALLTSRSMLGWRVEDRCGRPVDVAPVGDVADLVLGAELGGQRLQPLLPAGDQHAAPALPRQLPRGRGADAAGRTGDDGDLHAAD